MAVQNAITQLLEVIAEHAGGGLGAELALTATRPLPLEADAGGAGPGSGADEAAYWLVTAGSVQVFALPRDVRPAPRTPLFAVEAGGLLVAPPARAAAELLAVGIEPGTTVRPVAGSALRALAAGSEAPVVARLVEGWTGDITAALRQMLTAEAWALAVGDAELEPPTSADALAEAGAWETIADFHVAALAQLRAAIDRAADDAAERAGRRLDYEERLGAATDMAFSSILGDAPALAVTGHGPDELLTVMRILGDAQGIAISPPPRGAIGERADPVETIARASGVRVRTIRLEREWWRSDTAPFLARRQDDARPVAVVPARGGYELVTADSARQRATAANVRSLAIDAHVLYRPLDSGPLAGRDLLRFALRPIRAELVWLLVYALVGAGLALVPPLITDYLFSEVVPGMQRGSLAWMAGLLVVSSLTGIGFVLVQGFAVLRIKGRVSTELQAAIWDRVLDLPIPFFRRFSSGELTFRVQALERIQELVSDAVIAALLSLPAGIASLAFAFVLDVRLGLFGLGAIVVVMAAVVIMLRVQMPHQWATRGQSSRLYATTLEIINGIAKLHVADAADRAYAKWGERFTELKRRFYRAQLSFAGITAFAAGAPAIGTLALLIGASTLPPGALDGGTFLAFNTAFIQAMAIFVGLAAVGTALTAAIPLYDELRPILAETRETARVQEDPGELRGELEVDHVTFRYTEEGPVVLDDIGFRAAPGEFVALVGPSGAGKSSILRVLLGFETPEVGTVRYDGRDLGALDPHAVRRQLGVVIQSGNVMPGDILTNIIGARQLTTEDAWEAARIAGLAEDIERLPMGMKTVVAEGGGGFSGGQRQRLLIARAVAGRPRILLFDEATSALDGRTQAAVSEAIERMRATRIVIAHRLSTVRSADRIVVLERGRVVQQGSYDELMEADGTFRRLALRQIV